MIKGGIMKVSLTGLTRSGAKADLFVAGFFKGEKDLKVLKKIDPAFARAAETAVSKKRFEGKTGEVFSSYQAGYHQAPEMLLLGLGDKKELKEASLRKSVGTLIGLANRHKAVKVRILLDSFLSEEVPAEEAVKIFSEMSFLASYRFTQYKTPKKDDPPKAPESVELVTEKKELIPELRPAV